MKRTSSISPPMVPSSKSSNSKVICNGNGKGIVHRQIAKIQQEESIVQNNQKTSFPTIDVPEEIRTPLFLNSPEDQAVIDVFNLDYNYFNPVAIAQITSRFTNLHHILHKIITEYDPSDSFISDFDGLDHLSLILDLGKNHLKEQSQFMEQKPKSMFHIFFDLILENQNPNFDINALDSNGLSLFSYAVASLDAEVDPDFGFIKPFVALIDKLDLNIPIRKNSKHTIFQHIELKLKHKFYSQLNVFIYYKFTNSHEELKDYILYYSSEANLYPGDPKLVGVVYSKMLEKCRLNPSFNINARDKKGYTLFSYALLKNDIGFLWPLLDFAHDLDFHALIDTKTGQTISQFLKKVKSDVENNRELYQAIQRFCFGFSTIGLKLP